MKKRELLYCLSAIDKAVSFVKEILKEKNILAFSGSLGAGKTTLITQLLKNLGVQETITSPTFSYVNEYSIDGKKIYHFDLYPIGSVNEFIVAGFDEYLHNSDAIILIEWPEAITSLLPANTAYLDIDYDTVERRKISWRNKNRLK